jgi:Zn-finger nucleic acid-binding protein
MSYFIRRGTTVKGPFSQAKLKELVQEKKLKQVDGISRSADGPWQSLGTVYKRIFGDIQSRTKPVTPTISDWTVNRGLLGKYKIEFVCPECSTELSSEESDIGQQDHCPKCGLYFVLSSSVADEIAVEREQRDGSKKAAAEEKQRQREEQQRQREEQQRQREEQRDSTKKAAAAEKQNQREQKQREREAEEQRAVNAHSRNHTLPVVLVGLFVVVAVILSTRWSGDGFLPDSISIGSAVSDALSGAKVTRVETGVGDVTITDDEDDISHVKIECNNGLEIEADWKRNPYNDFGYDIYEPTVNQNYNRLAVMMTARGAIASYLRGEYN